MVLYGFRWFWKGLEVFGRVWEGLEGVGRGGKGWMGPYNTQKPVRPSVRPPSVRPPSVRPSVHPSVRRPSVRPPSVRRPSVRRPSVRLSVRPSVYPNGWVCVTLQPPKKPKMPLEGLKWPTLAGYSAIWVRSGHVQSAWRTGRGGSRSSSGTFYLAGYAIFRRLL